MQPRLNIALKACRSAADIINTIYKTKSQDDLRSYDHLDEHLYIHLVNLIAESYPFDKDDILGPTNIDVTKIKKKVGNINFTSNINNVDKYVWVINPLDCYQNFINKIPLFNITISIFLNGAVQASLIYNPVLDQLATAIKGEGAIFENRKIRNINTSSDKILYVIDDRNVKTDLEDILHGDERKFGSRSTELVYIAEGKLDLVIYSNIDIWDFAAGLLICQESGVLVTGSKGQNDINESRSLLVAKESLHKKIIAQLS
jgi:myo-inositol-1(or 4)-monophosphatase|tara:strand:- start:10328 stop:11104 length:777 start_codon:yes stop_codon:yes gene_type:complete